MNIPHEDIRQRGDRSWSMRLLEQLIVSQTDEEVDEICDTFRELEDYRLEEPLLEILHDLSEREFVRHAASRALACSPTTETEEQRRFWWHSGDPIFRQHSLYMFEREDDDLLWEILSDSADVLYPDAIDKISWASYEELCFQKAMVDALSHESVQARKAAAGGLIYAEPVIAESALLTALREMDDDVFDAALTTVSFYRTQAILTGLHELSKDCPEQRFDEIDGVFGGVSHSCFNAMDWAKKHSPSAEHYFLKWLEPVAGLLSPEFAGRHDQPSETEAECKKPKRKTRLSKPKLVHPAVSTLYWNSMTLTAAGSGFVTVQLIGIFTNRNGRY